MDYGQQVWVWAHQAWQWAVPNGLLDVLKALAAPIVAAAALRVSRQQVRINETKLRLDMYDRRAKVYGAVKELLSAFTTNGTLSTPDLIRFREQAVEADFLFGAKVQAYMFVLDQKARRLIIEVDKYERGAWKTRGEDPIDAYAEVDALQEWFIDQPAAAKLVFQPALSLEPAATHGWLKRLAPRRLFKRVAAGLRALFHRP